MSEPPRFSVELGPGWIPDPSVPDVHWLPGRPARPGEPVGLGSGWTSIGYTTDDALPWSSPDADPIGDLNRAFDNPHFWPAPWEIEVVAEVQSRWMATVGRPFELTILGRRYVAFGLPGAPGYALAPA